MGVQFSIYREGEADLIAVRDEANRGGLRNLSATPDRPAEDGVIEAFGAACGLRHQASEKRLAE